MTTFNIHSVKREDILRMVKEEQNVRYSKQIQSIYTQQYLESTNNPNYENVNIEQIIQKHILRKFGFNDSIESLEEYWKIPSTYWNDEEIKNSIFYMKLNIFKYPTVNLDDNIVDTQLIDYQTNAHVSLASLETLNRPLIILAGSMT
jgi:hypothetical protein